MSSETTVDERRKAQWILGLSLVAGAVMRVWVAFTDDGVHWPDEIYQSLEPAHQLAFGYGLKAWEFLQGARSWALPGMIAAIFKLSSWVGLDEPREYLMATRLIFCAMSLLTVVATERLARALGAGPIAAACGAAILALFPLQAYFAPKATGEMVSALLIAAGLAIALQAQVRTSQLLLAASLLGLAVFARLQSGYFCLFLLIVLWARGQKRDAKITFAALSVWALLFGGFDWLTWGRWFHSALVYLDFNVIHGKSESFGRSPFYYYAQVLGSSWWAMLALVPLTVVAAKRVRGSVVAVFFFLFLHSCLPHKELRFLLPIFPLWAAAAAVGLQQLSERRLPALSYAALGLSVVSAITLPRMTFMQVGMTDLPQAAETAFNLGGPENRLLWAAHGRPDLCGLKIMSVELPGIGGYGYLHRPVPLYRPNGPGAETRFFNYVIAHRGLVEGEVVAEDNGVVLVRLHSEGCQTDTSYTWHLN